MRRGHGLAPSRVSAPRASSAALVVAALTACGGSAGPAAAPASGGSGPSAESAAPESSLAAQLGAGAQVFKDRCASCHGGKGEGDSAPAIAGAHALPISPPAGARLRKGEFKNAADVEGFVKAQMPIDAPGTLTDAQAFAVVAWELKASGTDLGSASLDAASAANVHVH